MEVDKSPAVAPEEEEPKLSPQQKGALTKKRMRAELEARKLAETNKSQALSKKRKINEVGHNESEQPDADLAEKPSKKARRSKSKNEVEEKKSVENGGEDMNIDPPAVKEAVTTPRSRQRRKSDAAQSKGSESANGQDSKLQNGSRKSRNKIEDEPITEKKKAPSRRKASKEAPEQAESRNESSPSARVVVSQAGRRVKAVNYEEMEVDSEQFNESDVLSWVDDGPEEEDLEEDQVDEEEGEDDFEGDEEDLVDREDLIEEQEEEEKEKEEEEEEEAEELAEAHQHQQRSAGRRSGSTSPKNPVLVDIKALDKILCHRNKNHAILHKAHFPIPDAPAPVPQIAPSTPEFEYYVKWREMSYIHCEWVNEGEIRRANNGGQRLDRYWKLSAVEDPEEPYEPAFGEVLFVFTPLLSLLVSYVGQSLGR